MNIVHDKISLEVRCVPLNVIEMSQAEDILIDSFLVNTPELRDTIESDYTISKTKKDIRDRIKDREQTVAKVGSLLFKHWGPREKSEIESLSDYTVARVWILTEEEREMRDELKKQEALALKIKEAERRNQLKKQEIMDSNEHTKGN
jgi:hypothetical protein